MRLASSSSASASVWVVITSIAAVSLHHPPQPLVQPAKLGVGGDPLLQAARLADIERVALGIEHAIDAGVERHGGQRGLDGGGAGRGGAAGGSLMASIIGRFAGVRPEASAVCRIDPPNVWISLWAELARIRVKAAESLAFRQIAKNLGSS